MKNLLAAAAFAALLSVSASAQSWTRLEGQYSGIARPRAVIVTSEAQWKTLWKEHDPSEPAPDVDFSRVQVVAVFAGRTETAGVRVKIVVQRDPLDSSRLNVFYHEEVSRGGFSAEVLCQPYAIVELPADVVVSVEHDAELRAPERMSAPAVRRDSRRMRAVVDSIPAVPSFDGN
jgi:hypothetical protein